MYHEGNSIPQNLSPKESTLGLLNNLLIYRLRRVVHNDCSLLVVDLCINPRVTDQVNNPLLAFILTQA